MKRSILIFFLIETFCFGLIKSQTKFNVDENCLIGPNFWCLNDTTESLCEFSQKRVGLCGYTTKRCQIKTGDEFCKSKPPAQQQSPFEFNGGLTGVDENLFSYYMLSLYWPVSSCPAFYDVKTEIFEYFCSPYTNIDQPASERLVLHGLWPTFATNGNYQGWPQYCSSKVKDWSVCHIDGNLCPWKNTSRSDFTQSHYEYCLATEHVEPCIIDGKEILQAEFERLKLYAPGYLNDYNLFLNHEWSKHGSCCSSIFGNNITTYIKFMLDLMEFVTQPDSLIMQNIQQHAGEKIPIDNLEKVLNRTAVISCNSRCEVEEVALCIERDQQTGLPGRFVQCPLGAMKSSDSCRKFRCDSINVPTRRSPLKTMKLIGILNIILVLIVISMCLIKLFLYCNVRYFSNHSNENEKSVLIRT